MPPLSALLAEPIAYGNPTPLVEAAFVERPNRFVAVVQLPGCTQPVLAHVADPGRLKELLRPGAQVLLRDYGETTHRKLRYSLPLVLSAEGRWVSINSQLPNHIIHHLLHQNALPHTAPYQLTRREWTYTSPSGHKSRFDFLLEAPSNTRQPPCLMEVKGASLVEDRVCKFPDAPTVRGTRHLNTLIEARQEGYAARVVFVVQRADAICFTPHHKQDPAFAQALGQAMACGVVAHAFAFEMTPAHCRFVREIPIHLNL